MAALDDFAAEYARQHPHRAEKETWSDEAMVIATIIDRIYDNQAKALANIHKANYEMGRSMFAIKHKNCDE